MYYEWSEEDLSKALHVMSVSKPAYNLFRQYFKLPLPHPSTLKKKYSFVHFSPGFIDITFEYLNDLQNRADWNPDDALVMICHDEMGTSNVASLDTKSEQCIGPFNEAFVVMVKGIVKDFELPVYIDFNVSSKGKEKEDNQLCQIIESTILRLENLGFKVLAQVCDQVVYFQL